VSPSRFRGSSPPHEARAPRARPSSAPAAGVPGCPSGSHRRAARLWCAGRRSRSSTSTPVERRWPMSAMKPTAAATDRRHSREVQSEQAAAHRARTRTFQQRQHRERERVEPLEEERSVIASATGTTTRRPRHRALRVLETSPSPLDSSWPGPGGAFRSTRARASSTNPPMSRPAHVHPDADVAPPVLAVDRRATTRSARRARATRAGP
jgi:hypothetical protein